MHDIAMRLSMPSIRRCLTTAGVLTLLALVRAAPLSAWDRVIEVGGDGSPALAERRFEPVAGLADAQGIVVIGKRARAWGPPQGDALAFAPILAEDRRRRALGRLHRLSDGIVAGTDGCAATGLGSAGDWRWSWRGDEATPCIAVPGGESGLVIAWMRHVESLQVRVLALDQHGGEAWRHDFAAESGLFNPHLGVGEREHGLGLVLTRSAGPATAQVWRLDRSGRLLWQVGAVLATLGAAHPVPLDNGRLRIYTLAGAQAWAIEFTGVGSVQTASMALLESGEQIRAYSVGNDGHLYALVVRDGRASLVAWRGTERLWQSDVPGSACGNECTVDARVANDVVVSGQGVDLRQVLLTRFDRSTGAAQGTFSDILPAGYRVTQVVLLGEPAPGILAYAYSAPPTSFPPGNSGWIEGVRLLGRDGQALAARNLQQARPLPGPASALIGGDGQVTLAHRTGATGWQLQHVLHDDRSAWSQPFAPQAGPPGWGLQAVPFGLPGSCGDRSVCIMDGSDLRALSEVSGATTWRTPLVASTRIETRAWPGGRTLLATVRRVGGFPIPQPPSQFSSQQHVQVLGPTGASEAQVIPESILPLIAQRPDLGALLLASGPGVEVSRWQPPSPPTLALPNSPLRALVPAFGGQTAAIIGDDVAVLTEQAQYSGTNDRRRFDLVRGRGGASQWQLPLGLETSLYDSVRRYAVLPVADGGVVAYLETGTARLHEPAVDARARLVRVGADGQVRWARRFDPAPFVEAWPSLQGGHLLLAARRPHGLQLVLLALDADTGATVALQDPPCPRHGCGAANVRLLADGTIRAVGHGNDDGSAYPVLTRTGLFDPGPGIDLAQAGLAGAWYAPYTGGQGYTLRLFPADGGGTTVFLPWFTFDRAGTDGAASLRWYALQGDVAADDREATLAIVERRGGVFAAAPASPPVVVGQARLRFADCSTGLLDYRFDPDYNGGAEGSVALTPLLPRGAPCTQADGQALPAQAEYDPALTGHWFDPDRSGQGLELARIAPSATGDGLLYGAWFTFDPSPASDEPGDQHWFTLQGQDESTGGGVRTTIVQTLGGRFDSAPAGAPFRVGEADLLPGPDCSTLTLSYRFDDTDAAGNFRSRTGELRLRRLGSCPALPS
jgi:hypothetical protein